MKPGQIIQILTECPVNEIDEDSIKVKTPNRSFVTATIEEDYEEGEDIKYVSVRIANYVKGTQTKTLEFKGDGNMLLAVEKIIKDRADNGAFEFETLMGTASKEADDEGFEEDLNVPPETPEERAARKKEEAKAMMVELKEQIGTAKEVMSCDEMKDLFNVTTDVLADTFKRVKEKHPVLWSLWEAWSKK